MTFKNISQFGETSDYLSIFNGVLITDMIVIGLLIGGAIKSNVLKTWYKDLSLSAVIADVLIIFIGRFNVILLKNKMISTDEK